MEYLIGGDLMSLLIKKDILEENDAKFYIAECVIIFLYQLLAIEYVHNLNYIHRDLKPSNIFLKGRDYSVRIGDFGVRILFILTFHSCRSIQIRF